MWVASRFKYYASHWHRGTIASRRYAYERLHPHPPRDLQEQITRRPLPVCACGHVRRRGRGYFSTVSLKVGEGKSSPLAEPLLKAVSKNRAATVRERSRTVQVPTVHQSIIEVFWAKLRMLGTPRSEIDPMALGFTRLVAALSVVADAGLTGRLHSRAGFYSRRPSSKDARQA